MSMSLARTAAGLRPRGDGLPPVPWRDPYGVAPADLAAYIAELEAACTANPQSADLRVCLGIAHAVNYDVYSSMDALQEARTIDPENFWAQMKYAELHSRLGVLDTAEEATRQAADLAQNPLQLAAARRQLKEIRDRKRTSVRNVAWTKPLTAPALVLAAMVVLIFIVSSLAMSAP
jgi:cytochrome c-type biogenesis protein CcmH/NrfG